jgi:hypothetical protein
LINYWRPTTGRERRARERRDRAMRVVVNAKPWVLNWFADHEGRVRAGEGGRRSGTLDRVRPRERGRSFETLADYDRFSAIGFSFAGFDPDPNKLYVYRADRKRADRAVRLRPRAPRARSAADLPDPTFDVAPLVQLAAHGPLLGVRGRRRPAERPLSSTTPLRASRRRSTARSRARRTGS